MLCAVLCVLYFLCVVCVLCACCVWLCALCVEGICVGVRVKNHVCEGLRLCVCHRANSKDYG